MVRARSKLSGIREVEIVSARIGIHSEPHSVSHHTALLISDDFMRAGACRAKLRIEMPRKTEQAEAGGDQLRLPTGVVLKPPVSAEDLKADTECDPQGAEEFAVLIRALRRAESRSITF